VRTLYERAILTWKLFWDRRVSLLPKLIPALAVAYAISPLDLAPALAMGPLAPLGVLDDVGILLLALGLFIEACPPDVVREYQRELGASRSNLLPGGEPDVVEGEARSLDE
jgi:uncharacterized membrane protein YkvA (DUF1232 family)